VRQHLSGAALEARLKEREERRRYVKREQEKRRRQRLRLQKLQKLRQSTPPADQATTTDQAPTSTASEVHAHHPASGNKWEPLKVNIPTSGIPKWCKEFMLNTYHFGKEAVPGISDQALAKKLGITRSTLVKVRSTLDSPRKKGRKAEKSILKRLKIDQMDSEIIRATVYDAYKAGRAPTVEEVLSDLRGKVDFPYSQ
jgi:hypothetical protein